MILENYQGMKIRIGSTVYGMPGMLVGSSINLQKLLIIAIALATHPILELSDDCNNQTFFSTLNLPNK